jgi:pimeloyl-ACP methyl ester carboxylesterase
MTTTERQRQTYSPVDAPRQVYTWRGHQVAYYVNGSGPPLLLVHSINAAASAFEMRMPFAGFRDRRRVYALDLLGYGGSDRPEQLYTGADYVALISDFAAEVIGERTAVIASSLGSAYTIKAAAQRPEQFGALTLICPVGITQLAKPERPGPAYSILRGPVGDALFAGLVSRPSIRLFLTQQAYYDPRIVDDHVLNGFYETSHQPEAKWAPICFLTMLLNCDISADFEKLQQPLLLVWGRQATTTPVSQATQFLERNPRARLEIIDQARLLVQDERPQVFNTLVKGFLEQGA